MNTLWYGDCLTVIQKMKASSVDLIYLDPPFNSNRNYHGIYKDETGRPLPDQVEAFCDMWTLDEERERALRHMPVLMRDQGIDDDTVEFWRIWMNALRKTNPALLAYLSYMVERIVHMRVLLRPTGSLYLHCDQTVSHYIKVMLDGVFGHQNFRNEITWKRTFAHGGASRWGDVHDTLLFYTKNNKYTWNNVLQAHDESYVSSKYRFTDSRGRYRLVVLTGPGTTSGYSGKAWRGYNPTNAGRHWAVPKKAIQTLADEGVEIPSALHDQLDLLYKHRYIIFPKKRDGTEGVPEFKLHLSKGHPIQDVVTDIPPINSQAKERLHYATQKPVALLARIISASTNEGDVVLDPFCGCATTLEAAHNLNRQWIGIDIAIHAIKRVARIRLTERCGLVEGRDYEIKGVPRNLEGTKDLWARDKYHFQKWAVEQVEGFVTTKRASDGGIDGRLYFVVPDERDLQSMVIEVKGGANVNIADVRALGDVLQRNTALMAGLIVMEPLGDAKMRNFKRLMAEAGDLEVLGVKYARMQILTVDQILSGERFTTPTIAGRHAMKPKLPLG